MLYLSQTFESYQRVKIYKYSENDLGLNCFTVMWNLHTFYSLQIEHYALKIVFCVPCYSVIYFPTRQLIILFMKSIHILVWTEMIICTEKQQI